MGVGELSAVLWRERHLLELLLFRLEVQELALSLGRSRWLSHTTREIEQVLDQIRITELARAVAADAAADELALRPGSGLFALTDAAPEPWNELLHSHREGLLVLTRQIQDVARGNRDLLATMHRDIRRTLVVPPDGPRTRGTEGTAGGGTSPARPVSGSTRSSVRSVTSRSALPTPVPTQRGAPREAEPDVAVHGPEASRQRAETARAGQTSAPAAMVSASATIPDADHTAALVDLGMQEIVCQAALAAASRVLQPSLLDFLRSAPPA